MGQSAKRWVSVSLCGTVAGFVLFWVCALQDKLLESWNETVHSSVGLFGFGLTVLLLVVLAGCIQVGWLPHARVWRSLLHMRHTIEYPGTIMMVAIGMLVLGFLLSIENVSGESVWTEGSVTIGPLCARLGGVIAVACLLFGCVGHYWPSRNKADRVSEETIRRESISSLESRESFEEWLRADNSVNNEQDDWFGHRRVARRIADKILGKELASFALIGAKGAGKTSILNMARKMVEGETQSVVIVQVSVWPYESAEAACRGILDRIIQELGDRVDTLGLQGIPGEYVASIEKTSGWLGALFGISSQQRSPKDVLGQIDCIASAIGLRVVVWVEDVERFADGVGAVDSPAATSQASLHPLQALLYLIDEKSHMSVALAATSGYYFLESGKISQYRFEPPVVSDEDVWKILCRTRKYVFEQSGPRVILPSVSNNEDVPGLFIKNELMQPAPGVVGEGDLARATDTAQLLCKYLNNPRQLKSVLRETTEIYSDLRGEVHYESVLYITAIRVRDARLFEYAVDHLDDFQDTSADIVKAIRKLTKREEREAGQEDPGLLKVMKVIQETDLRHQEFLVAALRCLFPSGIMKPSDQAVAQSHPQGFSSNHYGSYFQRYMQRGIGEELSDQEALRAIESWSRNQSRDIFVWIADAKLQDKARQFLRSYPAIDLADLFAGLADVLLPDDKATYENYIQFIFSLFKPDATNDQLVRGVIRLVDRLGAHRCEAQFDLLLRVLDPYQSAKSKHEVKESIARVWSGVEKLHEKGEFTADFMRSLDGRFFGQMTHHHPRFVFGEVPPDSDFLDVLRVFDRMVEIAASRSTGNQETRAVVGRAVSAMAMTGHERFDLIRLVFVQKLQQVVEILELHFVEADLRKDNLMSRRQYQQMLDELKRPRTS